MHTGGTVHLPEDGPGQEASNTGLGNGLGHIWAGSSGTSKAEQSLEGLGPLLACSHVPVKREVTGRGLSIGCL